MQNNLNHTGKLESTIPHLDPNKILTIQIYRVFAYIIDLLLGMCIGLSITAIIEVIIKKIIGTEIYNQFFYYNPIDVVFSPLGDFLNFILLTTFCFFALFLLDRATGIDTLGRGIFKLKIYQMNDTQKYKFWKESRSLIKFSSVLLIGFGFSIYSYYNILSLTIIFLGILFQIVNGGMVFFTGLHQAIHDRIVGTAVYQSSI